MIYKITVVSINDLQNNCMVSTNDLQKNNVWFLL